jgi:hypothetical protein
MAPRVIHAISVIEALAADLVCTACVGQASATT